MLSAYVLIQTEVGKAAQVVQAIRAIEGVQWAETVTGPYDGIARAQAPGLDELGRLVVSRIQVVDGITRTLTCTVLARTHTAVLPPPRPRCMCGRHRVVADRCSSGCRVASSRVIGPPRAGELHVVGWWSVARRAPVGAARPVPARVRR